MILYCLQTLEILPPNTQSKDILKNDFELFIDIGNLHTVYIH